MKKRNPIAKELRTDKYRMRVVSCKKIYNRAKEQAKFSKNVYEY